jgi:glycosyltransferase involved in cell wall biosynthesis
MNQLVSIAIPTYSRLNYLKEAVESALAQTYPNIEVLIGQDPGKDGLDESIRAWSQTLVSQNPKVRYQCNSDNLGLAGNWNALADSARGEYLVIIGDDDRLLPNFVETLVSAVVPSGQVAFSNHYIINSKGECLETESYKNTKYYHRDRIPPGEVSHPEIWVWQNSIPMSASLIRTEDVRRLRFKNDLNTPEIELFIRLAKEGGRFLFVPEYLSEYRVHEQTATVTGLWIERLVTYLLPTPVSPEVEPYKRELLSHLMVNAVSRCLLQGQWRQAEEFLRSEYYPDLQRKRPTGLMQTFCTALPPFLGCRLYGLGQSIKRRLRSA